MVFSPSSPKAVCMPSLRIRNVSGFATTVLRADITGALAIDVHCGSLTRKYIFNQITSRESQLCHGWINKEHVSKNSTNHTPLGLQLLVLVVVEAFQTLVHTRGKISHLHTKFPQQVVGFNVHVIILRTEIIAKKKVNGM